jgi:hypothetical protein
MDIVAGEPIQIQDLVILQHGLNVDPIRLQQAGFGIERSDII